jgi:hypothetical protein
MAGRSGDRGRSAGEVDERECRLSCDVHAQRRCCTSGACGPAYSALGRPREAAQVRESWPVCGAAGVAEGCGAAAAAKDRPVRMQAARSAGGSTKGASIAASAKVRLRMAARPPGRLARARGGPEAISPRAARCVEVQRRARCGLRGQLRFGIGLPWAASLTLRCRCSGFSMHELFYGRTLARIARLGALRAYVDGAAAPSKCRLLGLPLSRSSSAGGCVGPACLLAPAGCRRRP